jgi:hypothetical protein
VIPSSKAIDYVKGFGLMLLWMEIQSDVRGRSKSQNVVIIS